MSLFEVDIEKITEEHVNSLCQNQVKESLTLEFKRQLDPSNTKDKAEAAKDVSAMANTAGGRILCGVAETTLSDGSKVADSISPSTDAAIESRLADVLCSSIHPRPRFRTWRVPVTNSAGFVLVVEVYPAYSGDLHMVTGFKEHRFYRRGEQRTVLMMEPEIREAYARIAASRQALEASIEKAIAGELARVPATHESVLIVPWYGHRDLVNARRLGERFGHEVASAGLEPGRWDWDIQLVQSLAVVADGYRVHFPPDLPMGECYRYLSIQRTGLVHGAQQAIENRKGPPRIHLGGSLELMVACLLTARYVPDKCAYWGPVRVIHRLNAASPFWFVVPRERFEVKQSYAKPIAPGTYEHMVPEVNLKEHGASLKMILRELLDQIFQTEGRAECPWFDASGKIKEELSESLPSHVFEQLGN